MGLPVVFQRFPVAAEAAQADGYLVAKLKRFKVIAAEGLLKRRQQLPVVAECGGVVAEQHQVESAAPRAQQVNAVAGPGDRAQPPQGVQVEVYRLPPAAQPPQGRTHLDGQGQGLPVIAAECLLPVTE